MDGKNFRDNGYRPAALGSLGSGKLLYISLPQPLSLVEALNESAT